MMGESCRECGAQVFVGETRCPTCNAPIPDAVDTARAAGVEVEGAGGPPPEGLDLIIQKHRADSESYTHTREDVLYEEPDYRTSSEKADAAIDNIAYYLKPERDAAGNVKVDMKYAIIGLIIVLVVLVAIAAYFFYIATSAHSSFTRYSSLTK